MIVAFTGHRPNKLGGYNLPNPTYIKVCLEIDKHLRELKPEKVISGMALGVDQWAANIAIKLQIPLLAAVPFEGQEKKWPEHSRIIYQKLLAKASEMVYVCSPGYSNSKMQERNKWMVDQCDILIAVWDGTAGGTGNCVKYAQSVKKTDEIIFIDPRLTP
jgi:uncharacterized phage-like protein YoqJ